METYGSSRIAGFGAYLPESRVTTDELMRSINCSRFGIPENYISRHIGIKEKRVAEATIEPSGLAALASEIALTNAGVSADEIDLIIYTGITRDYEEPSTAHSVQCRLGARKATCMDTPNACLGFMTGLWVADSFIYTSEITNVLVCTGEIQSRTVNSFLKPLKYTKNKEYFKKVFGVLTVGDAGGAAVVQRKSSSGEGLNWIRFYSEGSLRDLCTFERTENGVKGQMIMQEISSEILKIHRSLMPNTYEKLGWHPDNVDIVYAHQVGSRPHEEMIKMTSIQRNKAPISYECYGNLSSATIPTCMHLYPPKRGDKILLLGAGSGISICQGGMTY